MGQKGARFESGSGPSSCLQPHRRCIAPAHRPHTGAFLFFHIIFLLFTPFIQEARTNQRAAETVLQDIQTLAEIIGESKEELDSRITSLSTTDQQTVESAFRESPMPRAHFDLFYRHVSWILAPTPYYNPNARHQGSDGAESSLQGSEAQVVPSLVLQRRRRGNNT